MSEIRPIGKERVREWTIIIIALVVAFDVAWLWQWQSGALASELGGHPDEAAHYVTGLMVRDYVASGLSKSPMVFAEEYYAFYPKIGLGVWPPVFYGVQAVWTLVAGDSCKSVLHLMAVLAAILGLLTFQIIRRELGLVFGIAGALALLCLPLVRESYGMVMAETLSAIWMIAAAICWGRYLVTFRASAAILFGIFAGMAIMTKGTGLALALQAVIAIAISGNWGVLRRVPTWIGALLTGLIAGPWTWIFRNYGREKGGWLESTASSSFVRESVPYYAGKFGTGLGLVFLLAFCWGAYAIVMRAELRRGNWASLLALVVAVLGFHSLMPVGLEARHLVPAIPAGIAIAMLGIHELIRKGTKATRDAGSEGPQPLSLGVPVAVVSIAVVGVAVAEVMLPREPGKHWSGFRELAHEVINDPTSGTVLVSSDARGEGMFISELASAEKRPGHTVKRANKEMAKMDWAGRNSRPKFENSDEVAAWFNRNDYTHLVVDVSMPEAKRGEHHDQLRQAAEQNRDLFWPVGQAPAVRGGMISSEPIVLYRIRREAIH